MKIEILNLAKYVQFLQKKGGKSWFFLAPSKNPKYNFMKWDGYLQVPSRPEIKFKMVILLPSSYPNACPRAFAEESIAEYAGKVFLKMSLRVKKFQDCLFPKMKILLFNGPLIFVRGLIISDRIL